MKALILAAGLGTRLRPHSANTPKPLFTLAGKPLLELHIHRLIAGGCEAIVINTHHLHTQIEAFVASRSFDIPVAVRYEPVILGTGGAIKNLSDFWDERPFIVINADIWTDLDLRAVWEFHGRSQPAGTLVLVPDPEFNSVAVDEAGWIREFARPGAAPPAGSLTFTGIQVLDPAVLGHIPPGRFVHSIDVFRAMLAEGCRFRAFIAPEGAWTDLGTPARYRRAAVYACAREAWRSAFGEDLPERLNREKLQGDGSDRHWYRLESAGRSLVMADHHLRASAGQTEVDAFIQIGRHLARRGLPVPRIHFADAFAGLVFLEDLGRRSLQAAVCTARDRSEVLEWYRQIISRLIALAVEGGRFFEPAWTYQTPAYTREMVMERECRYFVEAFLNGTLGLGIDFERLAGEFARIAENASSATPIGFMHRDLQARNILLKDGRPYFIDFQGGRLGPLQYDLASLLIDPYVDLSVPEQEQLFMYAASLLPKTRSVDPAGFRRGYRYCALARNLQILGAFGFLSRVKGKRYFEEYIAPALQGLARRLEDPGGAGLPQLRKAVALARKRWTERTPPPEARLSRPPTRPDSRAPTPSKEDN
jgi:aminoglycoside/choline kinase family phosphotransferase